MNEINGLPKLKIDIAGKSSADTPTDELNAQGEKERERGGNGERE